ncbi:MFS transporter [Thermoactinospora rubra]|uniref:MFS transporter n=1 Tax=Thermoactinospora rubra TaxID=1088767 RepID=UPI000A0F4E12|nr:MFS transporter [Thermoactinospora rubra]
MRASVSARLGADFHKLWTASAVSNLGDGVTMAAGPLLVSTLTGDPVLVAGAGLAHQLPWLVFSLAGGAVADRVDRRRLILLADLARGAVMAALALAVLMGTVSIPVLYAVFFVLGACETLADTAAAGRLPSIVPSELLPQANARLEATFTVINMWLAKPFGAWLFAVAAAAPFGLNAATFVIAALAAWTMKPPATAHRSSASGAGALVADIREGVRWLWRHRTLRTLALTMGAMQVPFFAAFATFVLYAKERLGVSDAGFGILLTSSGVGALAGSVVAPRLQAAFRPAVLLRTGLLVECGTHLVLAITTNAWVAGATLVVFSVHAMVWGAVVATVRQRSVPDRLQGRVKGAYSLLDVTGMAAGTLLGGFLARALGLAGPYWIAFITTAAIITFAGKAVNRCDS